MFKLSFVLSLFGQGFFESCDPQRETAISLHKLLQMFEYKSIPHICHERQGQVE